MSSPCEIAREKLISLLADPNIGLNPNFVAICQRKGIDIPTPAEIGTETAPFVFDPGEDGSPNVLRTDAPIEVLEALSFIQYPCLVISARNAQQEKQTNRRLAGYVFWGPVTLDIRGYIAWSRISLPDGNDFETHLDALEEALLAVLNSDPQSWQPVLYANTVDFSRTDLKMTNNGELFRRCLQATVTTRVSIPKSEPLP
jgi:hypothetical protein